MTKIYTTFDEVEQDIKENTPPVVYKFRTWKAPFHKKIITEREVWFAHPHELNDPRDVRPPYNFVIGEIDWVEARRKIRAAGRHFEPHLTDQELDREVESRFQAIQADPTGYFQHNRTDYVENKSHYDPIGVFSCCASCENEPMWAYYGNNHYGFAVGFNTVELSKTLNCFVGHVEYDDTPIDYFLFGDNKARIHKEITKKSKKWAHEEELRFVTATIGINRNRACIFPENAVTEIVFGMETTKQVQKEIRDAAAISLPNVDFYGIRARKGSYGLEKVKM